MKKIFVFIFALEFRFFSNHGYKEPLLFLFSLSNLISKSINVVLTSYREGRKCRENKQAHAFRIFLEINETHL
jgi:hypothetical protein